MEFVELSSVKIRKVYFTFYFHLHKKVVNTDLLKLQKTPFAGSNANTDLGLFYRECQSAPQLQTFAEETVAEQIGDLSTQLEAFETSLQEYENVISSFCCGENNN